MLSYKNCLYSLPLLNFKSLADMSRIMRCIPLMIIKPHKVSSFLTSHQNTHNSVKYEVI